MMKRIIRSARLVLGLGLLVGIPMLSSMALAGHVRDAVDHTKAAVLHGKEGHADVCAEHADAALKSAKGARVKSPHLDEGIKHLAEAVKHGKAGHADACTEHAEGAATHLGEVKEQ
ncbi:MAG: small metal-binding protein SmbP [Nitrospira sp.]|nr:small metal-binding protein SmbP [Nitrospira sp.]